MAGEFDFIRWIRAQQRPTDLVRVGIGDDLAVLNWRPEDLLLVGADQVLDGVHFDSSIHTPRQIGRKVMNRNLSDCAAMGCLPAAAVATVALPNHAGTDYAQQLYLGVQEAADRFDCHVVGGDTGSWPGKLAVSVTILGYSGSVPPVTRAGAKPGDAVYVTGSLGGSILGRHMTFQPRVHEGRHLANTGAATAMIDLSDGLSRDLRHICAAGGVGAVVRATDVPIHPDADALAQRDHRSPLDHALHDGEDYELLFTSRVPVRGGPIRVGQITAEPGIWLERADGSRQPLDPQGWEHRL